MKSWTWVGRYALVTLVALLLGGAISELTVFKQTTLGTPKLSAATLAQFLGYGGALLMFAMLGHRTATHFRNAGNGTDCLAFLILPLTTLIVLSAGYDIGLVTLRPFLSASQKDIYNWLFVLGISTSALWLVVALYRHSESLLDLLKLARPAVRKCDSCSAALQKEAKFCAACGTAAAA